MVRLKLSVLFVLAALAMGTGSLGIASAQEMVIETSAGSHGNRFFGEAVLQVVVTDPDADNDNVLEDIEVTIEADPARASGSSIDIVVQETNEGSGRFEFFLTHVDADEVLPGDLDPINSAGVEGDGSCAADCAPLITFGPGGDLNINTGLYEEVRFEISSENAEVEVSYEETAGALALDRSSYGTTSFVYVSIVDHDANLNPSDRDQFTVDPDAGPNDDLLELNGGTFEDIVVFAETGDNTGVFEGKYRLGMSMLVNTQSLVLTLHEKANYADTLDAAENDSNNIDEVSFTVGNTDGSIDVGGGSQAVPSWDPVIEADKDSYSPGDTVHVTITDQDANVNAGLADSIQLVVSSRGNSIEVSALETGVSTGVFEASIALRNAGPGAIVPGGFVVITYTDERPADYSEKVQAGENPEKDFTLEVDVRLPVKTGTESIDVTSPYPEDITGGPNELSAGDSVVLATTIYNNNEHEQPFVAIIEVRDSEGVTVYLALQSGTLEPSGATTVGVLWQPESAGTFDLRAFAITSISIGTEPLSLPATSTITII